MYEVVQILNDLLLICHFSWKKARPVWFATTRLVLSKKLIKWHIFCWDLWSIFNQSDLRLWNWYNGGEITNFLNSIFLEWMGIKKRTSKWPFRSKKWINYIQRWLNYEDEYVSNTMKAPSPHSAKRTAHHIRVRVVLKPRW